MHLYFWFFLFTKTKANQTNKQTNNTLHCFFSFAFVISNKLILVLFLPSQESVPHFLITVHQRTLKHFLGMKTLRTATMASCIHPQSLFPVSSAPQNLAVCPVIIAHNSNCDNRPTYYLSQVTKSTDLLREGPKEWC